VDYKLMILRPIRSVGIFFYSRFPPKNPRSSYAIRYWQIFSMKRPQIRGDHTRFKGQLRHYHRSGSPLQEKLGGEGTEPSRSPVKWLKIALIVLSLLALGGIIAGLIVELG